MKTISIPFTQYHLPNGRTTQEYFDGAPIKLKPKVDEILRHGLEFTAEILSNGLCSFCISDNNFGQDYVNLVCMNGPEVVETITKLIESFDAIKYKKWVAEQNND